MEVKEHKDGKLITLTRPFDTRPKVLNGIYFFVFFAFATVFLGQGFSLDFSNTAGVIVVTLSVFTLYIASFRFINKALMTEKIYINKTELRLILKSFFGSKVQIFDRKKISDFRHLAKPDLTRHALAGDTFDYLGFDTQQKMINEMHGDNRLAFDYNGKTVTFGDNIYSWHFEELQAVFNETEASAENR